MSDSLRVLLLEDVPADAALIERELRKTWPDLAARLVDSRDAFTDALKGFAPHVILSDHSLPGFSGTDALALAMVQAPEVPFVFVTGSLDEETAVACIKAGAADYVLKDHLARLVPAVQAALELASTRRALRLSEEQLRHVQKLEAVGRLAGGVAHDFNNLISVILGYCELLHATLGPEDPRHADLAEVRGAAERAASLTRQLLAFSRRQPMQPQPVHVNDIVSNMERMLRRLLSEEVELATLLGEDVGWVQADRGQIEQVIVNLAVNARDAMPDGGRLTIETDNAVLDESCAVLHPDVAPGHFVVVIVSDTGTGMDAETKTRLFEPFYTTKGPGKGTGLGLATVYGIVRQSGGTIYVYSEVGHGTSFKVYLPMIPAGPGEPSRAVAPERVLRGTETILLVEDEEALRTLTTRALAAAGYTVLEAGNGAAALELCANHAGALDLVITDVVLPGMHGREVVERLEAFRPGVAALYVSGYTADAVSTHGAIPPGVPYLQKPFTTAALLGKIREVLQVPVAR